MFGCELLLFAIDFFSGNASVYLGLITYVLLPPFLVLGLVLIPIGARRKYVRVQKGLSEAKPRPLHMDLSVSTHRNAFVVFVVGTTVFLIMTMIGSYKAYHYTESVQFCGTTCHGVMRPEYTAYQDSPHARVACVECHIGSGAGAYVHYKVAGVRMLAKTLRGDHARPIPVPVTTLRPAKETCEQCHWPGKSFSAIEIRRTYFADEPGPGKISKWNIQMLMHVGGKNDRGSGIHAHMYNNNDIYYAADDATRQKITWVKSVSKSGEEKIFTTRDSPYKDAPPPESKIRKMDCMDCHNRPAHHFDAPIPLINRAMEENKIDPQIPLIKSKAVEALSKKYTSQAQAVEHIRSTFFGYYTAKQAEYYAAHQKEIARAVDAVIAIYQQNFFPDMKVRWEAYPSDIGHMISPGCFRCHDEEHKTKQGAVISRDCTICHTITAQGSSDALQKNADGLEFQHPFEDDGSWKTMNCVDCHSGGS